MIRRYHPFRSREAQRSIQFWADVLDVGRPNIFYLSWRGQDIFMTPDPPSIWDRMNPPPPPPQLVWIQTEPGFHYPQQTDWLIDNWFPYGGQRPACLQCLARERCRRRPPDYLRHDCACGEDWTGDGLPTPPPGYVCVFVGVPEDGGGKFRWGRLRLLRSDSRPPHRPAGEALPAPRLPSHTARPSSTRNTNTRPEPRRDRAETSVAPVRRSRLPRAPVDRQTPRRSRRHSRST